MEIREMRLEDMEPTLAFFREGGGGDRRQLFHYYFTHPNCHPLLGLIDGEIVATTVATCTGSVGWMGSVFTTPARRKQGIGTTIVKAAVEFMHQHGCRSIALLASPFGRPIYERLGFPTIGRYLIYEGPSLPELPQAPGLRKLTSEDLTRVYALDRHATGEDRSALLQALGVNGWVVEQQGELVGYHIPTPWGEGPIIAADAQAGRALLDVSRVRAQAATVRIALPQDNVIGCRHLEEAGFREWRLQTRMVLGEPLPWNAPEIWGLINMGLG